MLFRQFNYLTYIAEDIQFLVYVIETGDPVNETLMTSKFMQLKSSFLSEEIA